MNILVDKLPAEVEVSGRVYPIRADFRTSLQFEQIVTDPEISDEEKIERLLVLYYPEIPQDIAGAAQAALKFYVGPQRSGKERRPSNPKQQVYSSQHDAEYIFAAFWEAYQINLSEIELHWWTFRALFAALPADTMFVKIVGWRAAEITDKMPAVEKKRLRELKKAYALPSKRVKSANELEKILMGDGNIAGFLVAGE